jgi:hypothetical protein
VQGWSRRAVLAALAGVGVGGAVILSGCGNPGGTGGPGPAGATGPPGGLVSVSPIPLTANPSLVPDGDTVPTGILVAGWELVLSGTPGFPAPQLWPTWVERATGRERDTWPASLGGDSTTVVVGGPLNIVEHTVVGDGTVINWGVVTGAPDWIVLTENGRNYPATFARWSVDRTVTFWWLRRPGGPLPAGVPYTTCGLISPQPAQRYPLLVAFRADGTQLGRGYLQPEISGPKCDG